jgi:lipoprotein-anchoring transpeptidase ErfK/SrfK
MFAVLLALGALAGLALPASAAHAPVAAPTVDQIWDRNPEAEDVRKDRKPTPAPMPALTRTAAPTPVSGGGERWIEVILSQRLLLAHEGEGVVFKTIVSVGKPSTPTVRGTFRIYSKLRATRMSGPGYNLPNVPHTMYFYRGYAIHGAYWVKKFGTAVSHGCVNVNLTDAAWLFNWAAVGTRVVIRS